MVWFFFQNWKYIHGNFQLVQPCCPKSFFDRLLSWIASGCLKISPNFKVSLHSWKVWRPKSPQLQLRNKITIYAQIPAKYLVLERWLTNRLNNGYGDNKPKCRPTVSWSWLDKTHSLEVRSLIRDWELQLLFNARAHRLLISKLWYFGKIWKIYSRPKKYPTPDAKLLTSDQPILSED